LKNAICAKRLLLREPLRLLREVHRRSLLVTPQIDALLDGHIEFGVFPDFHAERFVGIFSAGQLMTVSRRITRRKPDIEQVEGADEVWALCIRTPRPGWRILGRWYEPDVFVALRAWDKARLARNYRTACEEVIEDWNDLFADHIPFSAVDVGHYIGGVYRNVDVEEE
jgi:hypothetical protein